MIYCRFKENIKKRPRIKLNDFEDAFGYYSMEIRWTLSTESDKLNLSIRSSIVPLRRLISKEITTVAIL